jgi:hypothetical protein
METEDASVREDTMRFANNKNRPSNANFGLGI